MQEVKPLTRAEILSAAEQAERYPPGHGGEWGWGPLADWFEGDPVPAPEVVQQYG